MIGMFMRMPMYVTRCYKASVCELLASSFFMQRHAHCSDVFPWIFSPLKLVVLSGVGGLIPR